MMTERAHTMNEFRLFKAVAGRALYLIPNRSRS